MYQMRELLNKMKDSFETILFVATFALEVYLLSGKRFGGAYYLLAVLTIANTILVWGILYSKEKHIGRHYLLAAVF